MNNEQEGTINVARRLLSVIAMAGLLLLTGACTPAEPEVFALPHLTAMTRGTTAAGQRYSISTQHYVIAHAPDDRARITALVARYLDATAPPDELAKHTAVVRLFYRETRFTPRDYAESSNGYFDHDRIEDHARDLLLMVKSLRGKPVRDYHFFAPEELR